MIASLSSDLIQVMLCQIEAKSLVRGGGAIKKTNGIAWVPHTWASARIMTNPQKRRVGAWGRGISMHRHMIIDRLESAATTVILRLRLA